jgi:hypothetical protein
VTTSLKSPAGTSTLKSSQGELPERCEQHGEDFFGEDFDIIIERKSGILTSGKFGK